MSAELDARLANCILLVLGAVAGCMALLVGGTGPGHSRMPRVCGP